MVVDRMENWASQGFEEKIERRRENGKIVYSKREKDMKNVERGIGY